MAVDYIVGVVSVAVDYSHTDHTNNDLTCVILN